MDKKEYRITEARPIAGRMRIVGATVWLTEREHQAEIGWGGLELVETKKPVKPAAKAEQ